MSLLRYSAIVSLVAAGAWLLAWALLLRHRSTADAAAAALGTVFATVNTVSAYGLIRWSEGRSPTAFMTALLGGMVGRMALLLGATAAAVVGAGLPRLPLVLALLPLFALFLGLELAIVHRQTGSRRAPVDAVKR